MRHPQGRGRFLGRIIIQETLDRERGRLLGLVHWLQLLLSFVEGILLTPLRVGRRQSDLRLPRHRCLPLSLSSPPASALWVCLAGAGSGRTTLLSQPPDPNI